MGRHVVLLLLSLLALSPLRAQTCISAGIASADTVLGAVLDTPPLSATISGVPIQIFEGARNPILRKQGIRAWPEMAYYYSMPLRITRRADGSPIIEGPIQVGRSEVIEFDLGMPEVDKKDIVRLIRDSSNAHVDPNRVAPLTVFGVEIRMTGVPTMIECSENGRTLAGGVHVELVPRLGEGAAVATRLRKGASLRVKLTTLVKLTQLQEVRVTWSDVQKTQTYQKYAGPAGPTYITASQAVDTAFSILGELDVFAWQEGEAGSFAPLFASLIDRVVARRERRELELADWTSSKQFRVDVGAFQNQRDLLKRIATDSRNLKDNEWCQKYKTNLETLSRSASDQNDDTEFGLQAIIPKVNIPIGLDFGSSSAAKSLTESSYKHALDKSDCGKTLAQQSFTFSKEGEFYIPKSIYVYQNNLQQASAAEQTQLAAFKVLQRYGSVESSISSR